MREQNDMWRVKLQFQRSRWIVVAVATMCAPLSVAAQEAPRDQTPQTSTTAPAKAPQPYGGGSPLDVLMHAKLWEDPPQPKPFVTESREPLDTLSYQPTAKDEEPKRPKPLSAKELKALQGALEHAGAHNEKAGGVKDKEFADVSPAQRRKGKAKKLESKPTQLHRR